ncbi:hypothetical protein PHMEG_00019039 [Phytophthora megakarya]|uniref:Uncharacterized protein n=1 Tax=Phytophthora megakarya TaxID=4795 RepID=A0A225VSK1_9STRA|nr:hypothetical protein PHMEG_00019039 [Phytophthora megakarya]
MTDEFQLLTDTQLPAKDIRSRRNLSVEFGEADPGDQEMKESARVPDVPVGDYDDPNVLVLGEEPEQYGRLDSDRESGDTSVYGDDEDLGPLEPDPGIVDEDVSSPELQFDKSLLRAVARVAKIASGDLKPDFLKDMKTNGWTTHLYQRLYPYMDEPFEKRPDD